MDFKIGTKLITINGKAPDAFIASGEQTKIRVGFKLLIKTFFGEIAHPNDETCMYVDEIVRSGAKAADVAELLETKIKGFTSGELSIDLTQSVEINKAREAAHANDAEVVAGV